MAAYIQMNNICKQFPGVKALDGVSFSLEKGNMVLLDAQTPEEAIIETAAKACVWKDGRLIAQNGTLLPEEKHSDAI